MRRGLSRAVAARASVAVVAGTTPATAWAEQGVPAAQRTSVTLVTGDRVELSGDEVRRIVPRPGRDGVRVTSYADAGHQYVVPHGAAELVAQGRVDRRLFDVTALVDFGYDDARRDTVPLVVRPGSGGVTVSGLVVDMLGLPE